MERRAPTPANGARDGFGTDVVWQFYDGSGWQLQPLGSFGALNALLKRRRTDERVRVLADQLLRLGVWRKGFLAFEYLFPWGGGRPGWISGMAQATGMQALAGAYRRLGDGRLLRAAARMRPAFERRPPWGVRRPTGRGRAHFLLYSQSPRLLVGNGFAQALLGLDRYREISGDPRAARLVEEGLAQARQQPPALRHRSVVAVLPDPERARGRVGPALPPGLHGLSRAAVRAFRRAAASAACTSTSSPTRPSLSISRGCASASGGGASSSRCACPSAAR